MGGYVIFSFLVKRHKCIGHSFSAVKYVVVELLNMDEAVLLSW